MCTHLSEFQTQNIVHAQIVYRREDETVVMCVFKTHPVKVAEQQQQHQQQQHKIVLSHTQHQ